jgi:hypothetical protein
LQRYPNTRCPKTLPHLGLQLTQSVGEKTPIMLARNQVIFSRLCAEGFEEPKDLEVWLRRMPSQVHIHEYLCGFGGKESTSTTQRLHSELFAQQDD